MINRQVEFDPKRHTEVWRLTAYSAETCILQMQIDQLRLYKLKPLDLLVFNLVALASVQRPIRAVAGNGVGGDLQPSNESNGTISRRRVAESLGLARTSVGRALDRLMSRGMVVERSRGRLQVPVGIVLQGPYASDPAELYSPVMTMVDQFLTLGVLRVIDPVPPEA